MRQLNYLYLQLLKGKRCLPISPTNCFYMYNWSWRTERAHLRDRSRLYCQSKKSAWACSGQMRCDSRGFENERSVWEREVQQRQTIWQCMTESSFEKCTMSNYAFLKAMLLVQFVLTV